MRKMTRVRRKTGRERPPLNLPQKQKNKNESKRSRRSSRKKNGQSN